MNMNAVQNHPSFLRLFLLGLISLFIFLPLVSLEAAPLVPCDGTIKSPCTFGSFLKLVQNVINYLLILAVPIATAFFAYAGFLVMTSGDDSGRRGRAWQIFKDIGWGVFWILAAWMVVSIIVTTLANPNISKYIPIEKVRP